MFVCVRVRVCVWHMHTGACQWARLYACGCQRRSCVMFLAIYTAWFWLLNTFKSQEQKCLLKKDWVMEKIHLVAWDCSGLFDYHYSVSSTHLCYFCKSFACLSHIVRQSKFFNLIKLFTLWDICFIFTYQKELVSIRWLQWVSWLFFFIFFSNFIFLSGIWK